VEERDVEEEAFWRRVNRGRVESTIDLAWREVETSEGDSLVAISETSTVGERMGVGEITEATMSRHTSLGRTMKFDVVEMYVARVIVSV